MPKITEVLDGKTQEELDAEAADGDGQHDGTQDGGDHQQADTGDEEGETLVVTIGDQKPPEEDENLNFKQLRDNRRELARENRELKRQLDATRGTTQQESTLGAKPKLEDFNYDTTQYETATEAWLLKKADTDAKTRDAKTAQERADAQWNEKLNSYGTAKEAFKTRAPDFPDAEIAIEGALSKVQQGLLLKASKDAPLLIYALYKTPARLKELAAMADPVDFTAELVRTEAQLKVSNKEGRTQAETRIGGTVAVGSGGDAHLEKLRAEAARTGDISKVTAYKRQMREKKSA